MNPLLTAVLAVIPPRLRPYAKSVIASAGALVAIVVSVWPGAPGWVAAAAAVLTALGVYGVPNVDTDGDGIPDALDDTPNGDPEPAPDALG